MQRYQNLMTHRDFRFVIWALGNDKKTFENTFRISFAETLDQTGVLDGYPNFWERIPIIDFQSIARKTLLSFLAS